MRRSRLRLPDCAFTLCALLIVLASASGCGSARGGASSSSIVTRPASVQVPSQAHRTEVSASCQAGEQMIGGGFSASDTFEYDARIVASYPSSASTWTVVATSSPAFTLSAEAYCLPANTALGVTIVQAPASPAGSAACPTGATLLSGGFQGATPASASHPDGNGWYAAGASWSAGRVYALCASQRVSAGSVVAASIDPHSSSNSYYPESDSVTCPAGQTATAGGFSGGDLILTSASAGAPYQSWAFTAGGDGDLALYVRCVSVTG